MQRKSSNGDDQTKKLSTLAPAADAPDAHIAKCTVFYKPCPDLERQLRALAGRFHDFANAVLSSLEPYPWDVWAADNDELMSSAGRLLYDAIGNRVMTLDLSRWPEIVDCLVLAIQRAKENQSPYAFAFLCEMILKIVEPEVNAPTTYDMHLGAMRRDDPKRQMMEARAFAALERNRGDAFCRIADQLAVAVPPEEPWQAPQKGYVGNDGLSLRNGDELHYRGKTANLERKPYNLLGYLLRSNSHSVLEEDAAEHVWPREEERTDSAMKSAVNKANKALTHVGHPCRVNRVNGHIRLQ